MQPTHLDSTLAKHSERVFGQSSLLSKHAATSSRRVPLVKKDIPTFELHFTVFSDCNLHFSQVSTPQMLKIGPRGLGAKNFILKIVMGFMSQSAFSSFFFLSLFSFLAFLYTRNYKTMTLSMSALRTISSINSLFLLLIALCSPKLFRLSFCRGLITHSSPPHEYS